MATVAGMSGIDLMAVTAELQEKLPLWVDKVYQFDPRTIGIRLNGENHAKYLLIIEAGRRAHLVAGFPEPPKNPPQFAMLLRKHLSGGKVLAIRQHGLERILVFDVGKGDTTYHLVTELYDDGNVILADGQMKIIKPLISHRFRERDVVAGVPYALSGTDPTGSEESFAAFLKDDDRDIVRSLAIGCMFGGVYAEYLCRAAGMEKTFPAKAADPVPLYRAIRDLFATVLSNRTPVVSKKGCEPVLIGSAGEDVTRYPSFNEALDAFYPMSRAAAATAKREKIPKDVLVRRHQEAAVRRFEEKAAKAEKAAAAIYENYAVVADIIATLEKESKKRSWQEIAEIVKKGRAGNAAKILAVHPEKAAVELDLGARVLVMVHDSIEQNAGRYYDEAKKFRRKREGALAAMARAVPVKRTARRDVAILKKQWYHRFRWFLTSDGVLVLGGRDAKENEELVKKYMAGGDTFLHADVHGASVVLVRGKTERMDEAAQFAASYSGAWKSGHFSADVYSASPGQVSKTPEHGEFITKGSFIVRGERTYYRDIPLGIAIGLQVEPQAAVIGGPPAVVRSRAKFLVELKPGQFGPNDIAKKVLRILQKKAGDGFKGMKAVLNTDAVAAFVPPGGSDIAGES